VYVEDHWEKTWVLDARVKALPFHVMEAVLRSDALQLTSENVAFSLALWWVLEQQGGGSTHQGQQQLLNRLLKTLRFARMSTNFLASIAQHPWVQDSGLLPAIFTTTMWWREPTAPHPALQPRSRVFLYATWSYEIFVAGYFTKAAVQALQHRDDTALAPLDKMVHSFPCHVGLVRQGITSYRIYLQCPLISDSQGMVAEALGSDERHGDGDHDTARGLIFSVEFGHVGGVPPPPGHRGRARHHRSTVGGQHGLRRGG
jgi:hypothetical protein